MSARHALRCLTLLCGLTCLQVLAATDDGAGLPGTLRVQLRPRVEVAHAIVRLGDVADLSTTDLGLMLRTIDLPIGHAPRPGEPIFLDRAALQRWLARQVSLQPAQLDWRGPAGTTVASASHEVDGEAVVAVAQAALRDHLIRGTEVRLPAARIELEPAGTPSTLVVPAGALTLVPRPLGRAAPASRMLVWVDASVDGAFIRTIPVRFMVGVFAPVPVAARALSAGTPLQPGDMVEREIDVAAAPDVLTASTPDTTQQLRHRLQPGEPLTTNALRTAPLVSRGAFATLKATSGAMTLESRVEVLQDGQLGEHVRVRPANATSPVVARVSGPGQVEFEP